MARRTRLATAVAFILLSIAAQAESFIRVDEDDSAARLQTAVTHFEKDGESVELIGAIHIADRAYYQTLSTRFEAYDSLLFEMIGGEKKPVVAEPAEPKEKPKSLSGLRKLYSMIAGFLKLTGQVENIDYTAKNFVHADLTLEEFNQLQAERGESVIGFAMAAAKADPAQKDPVNPTKLLQAMLSGNANRVKLEIVHTLGQADDQIGAFAGESVIISDRNHRCLEVMDREFAAGHKKLGIFYGAAHFPDMEKRLLELGFKRTGQEWLTAWDVPKPQPARPVGPPSPEVPAPVEVVAP